MIAGRRRLEQEGLMVRDDFYGSFADYLAEIDDDEETVIRRDDFRGARILIAEERDEDRMTRNTFDW